MKKYKLNSVRDIMAVAVRRKWWILVPFVILFGLSTLFAILFPKIYVSQTMILIQPREVPNDFVKDLISGTTDQRLMAIEQTILSRTNILRILGEFEARLNDLRGLNDDRKVDLLKKRIQIDFVSEKRNGIWLPTTSFKISYRDRDPDLAQKITARLASLFVEQDNRNRESQVFGTTEFLGGELSKVEEALRQSENDLKGLKERFRFELPSLLDTNLRTLDRLQTQKNVNVEAMDRYVTMQMNLERLLTETPPTIPKPASLTLPARNLMLDNYRKKQEEYNNLVARATPRHPDVLRLKAELEQLAKDIPPEDLASLDKTPSDPGKDAASKNLTPLSPAPAEASVTDPGSKDSDSRDTIPNPAHQNIVSQLNQVKTELQIRQRERTNVEKEMALYTQRVQDTSRAEQELSAAVRRNEELTKQHQDLQAKLQQAQLALSVESRQKGAQFLIVDPANYPLDSAYPYSLVIILAGIGGSIVLGLATALAADIMNQSIWTQPQLERMLGVPVLVEIPKIFSVSDLRRTRIRRWIHAAAFAAFVGAYGIGLYFLYLKQSRLISLLNPLIEKAIERTVS